jgi:hypothetical protein
MGKFLRLSNGIPRSFVEASSVTIYDQSFIVSSPITTGTNVSLPAAGTYSAADLEVYLNGMRLEQLIDYNYVGSPPRTQVAFTFDLVAGDDIRFRVDRGA